MMVHVKSHQRVLDSNPRPKFLVGDTAYYDDIKVRIIDFSYIAHPEYLIGGDRAKPGYAYRIDPVNLDDEEIAGWVPEKHLKISPRGKVVD